MKRIFLTSGLILCMACPAFADPVAVDITAPSTGHPDGTLTVGGGDPTCQEPTLRGTSGTSTFTAQWTVDYAVMPLNENDGSTTASGGASGTQTAPELYLVGGDGVYTNGTTKLKYTFTIAGSETDHPAFNAFYKASELLNAINFEVTVSTDGQALSKLANGDLAVWAAAWSSTIDPDMYQVYHKDSTATSTLNWGYKQIIQNTGGKYNEELALVEELSELIEEGRETTDQDERAAIYKEALDIVMMLAVELPTYQRDDLFAYNINKIDESTLNQDLSPYSGLLSDIHTVRLNQTK